MIPLALLSPNSGRPLNLGRSVGYVWKPEVIRKQLSGLKNGDLLVYLDAGCELNLRGRARERFDQYLQRCISDGGFLAFRLDQDLKSWCDPDVFQKLSIRLGSNSTVPVHQSGMLFLTPDVLPLSIVDEWSRVAAQSPEYFRGSSVDGGSHRHDQSVLSAILAESAYQGLIDETYFEPCWWWRGRHFPIWASRSRGRIHLLLRSAGRCVYRFTK